MFFSGCRATGLVLFLRFGNLGVRGIYRGRSLFRGSLFDPFRAIPALCGSGAAGVFVRRGHAPRACRSPSPVGTRRRAAACNGAPLGGGSCVGQVVCVAHYAWDVHHVGVGDPSRFRGRVGGRSGDARASGFQVVYRPTGRNVPRRDPSAKWGREGRGEGARRVFTWRVNYVGFPFACRVSSASNSTLYRNGDGRVGRRRCVRRVNANDRHFVPRRVGGVNRCCLERAMKRVFSNQKSSSFRRIFRLSGQRKTGVKWQGSKGVLTRGGCGGCRRECPSNGYYESDHAFRSRDQRTRLARGRQVIASSVRGVRGCHCRRKVGHFIDAARENEGDRECNLGGDRYPCCLRMARSVFRRFKAGSRRE